MTPMQLQYNELKEKYPDAILLFRLGDFYECFNSDAENAARVLNITLTGRGKDETRIPMAGIPYHALDNYLPKLLQAGYKVALAEQLEEAKPGKLVSREITKLYTPGVVTEDHSLQASSYNYLASVFPGKKDDYAVTFGDVSAGNVFYCIIKGTQSLKAELARIRPSEVIVPENFELGFDNQYVITTRSNNYFADGSNSTKLQLRWQSFGITPDSLIIKATQAWLNYVVECQHKLPTHITNLRLYNPSQHMLLDNNTIKNLELIYSLSGDNRFSLLYVLDECMTPMGSRTLRDWVLRPLLNPEQINPRLNTVAAYLKKPSQLADLRTQLKLIIDLERLAGKLGLAAVTPKELNNLAESLQIIYQQLLPLLQELLPEQAKQLQQLATFVPEFATKIETTLHPEAGHVVGDGNIIKPGFNTEIDQLRNLDKNSKNVLIEIQQREVERTGITSLKISYNKVFGYYLEITKSNLSKVPSDYIRKQTLANAERFITPELKQLEEQIVNASSRLLALEYQLFSTLRQELQPISGLLQQLGSFIAQIDVLANFAYLARQNRYIRPEIASTDGVLNIHEGRHTVVERYLQSEFTANNIDLNSAQQVLLLTGPNMAGKSTYLRQNALLVLMAQLGSFVPATSMQWSVVDRIFTRVGAGDNLAAGESTFMVEMTETANILHNASKDSLVILDEVGRGTSTYDGVALAWSILEYMLKHIGCRTLFATHYHELTALAKQHSKLFNAMMQVREQGSDVVFTHQVTPGEANRSYGVYVAKLAGLPTEVVQEAESILQKFHGDNKVVVSTEAKMSKPSTRPAKPRSINPDQLGF